MVRIFLSIFVFWHSSLRGEEVATNAPPRVVVEARDGSRLVGRLGGEAIGFAPLGLEAMRLPWGRVREVRAGATRGQFEITLRNGDRPAGTLTERVLRITTAFGEVSLPVEELVSLEVQLPGTAGGLKHLWSGEGEASDSVGGAHGQVSGNVRFVRGHTGRALAFAGEGRGVQIAGTAGEFGTNDFSVAFWFRSPAHQEIQYVITKRVACGEVPLWEVRSEADGRISLPLAEVRGKFVAHHVESVTAVCDDAWHQVVFTRHGTAVSVFVDGKLDATDVTPGVMNLANHAPLWFGSGVCAGQAGTTHFTGLLDEVAIYERALSAADVRELHEGKVEKGSGR